MFGSLAPAADVKRLILLGSCVSATSTKLLLNRGSLFLCWFCLGYDTYMDSLWQVNEIHRVGVLSNVSSCKYHVDI